MLKMSSAMAFGSFLPRTFSKSWTAPLFSLSSDFVLSPLFLICSPSLTTPIFSWRFFQRACGRSKGSSRAKWNPVLLARELNPTCLVKLPRFTRNELIILVAIVVLNQQIEDRVDHFLLTFFANICSFVKAFGYTGGPLNS